MDLFMGGKKSRIMLIVQYLENTWTPLISLTWSLKWAGVSSSRRTWAKPLYFLGSIRQRQLLGYAAFPDTAPLPYFWNAVSIAAEKVETNWPERQIWHLSRCWRLKISSYCQLWNVSVKLPLSYAAYQHFILLQLCFVGCAEQEQQK